MSSEEACTSGPPPTPANIAPWPTSSGVPLAPTDAVIRPRLLDLVTGGVTGSLTLVSAPAGTGKTVLVSTWAAMEGAPRPLTWLTTDSREVGTRPFWSRAMAGLLRSDVDVSGVALPAGAGPVGHTWLSLLAERIAENAVPVVLVVDEGDQLADHAIYDDLAVVMRRAGSKLRVVLLTRSDPSLPLHRYRLDGTLTEIRVGDLSFDVGEVTALFRQVGVDLTGDQASALVDRTGGWAAGLRFAAMSLAGRTDIDTSIAEFTGTQSNVSAYFANEVLDKQPEDLREVLLRTSVVDELPPRLCDELTGHTDGQRVLALLARGNAFIQPVPGAPGRYGYQSLFREFLRARLAFEQPLLVAELHNAAAGWWAGTGSLSRAVRHAAAAGAWADAARYLVDDLSVGLLVSDQGAAGLDAVFAELPKDVDGAAASIVRASLALIESDVERCTREIRRARTRLDDEPQPSDASSFSIALIEAQNAAIRSDVETGLAFVRTAEHQLRSNFPEAAGSHPELSVLLAICKARLLIWSGDFGGAREALMDASKAAQAPGCESLRVSWLGLCALLAAVSGRLRKAAKLADRSDAVARDARVEVAHCSTEAAVAHAWVETENFRLAAARERLDEAETVTPGSDVVTASLLALVRSRLLRATGDPRGSLATLRAARAHKNGHAVNAWLDGWLGAAEASQLIAEGRPDQAVDTIAQVEDPDRPEPALALRLAQVVRGDADLAEPVPPGTEGGSLDLRVTSGLVQTAQRLERGDQASARIALERSLRLAEPEQIRRPFVEAPYVVRQFLRGDGGLAKHRWLDTSADRRGVSRSNPETSGKRSVQSAADTEVVSGSLAEPLTSKELEVLGHLADLLSTDEIADEMFISVNTVRTHVRSILRKLGADRRNEAVRRAWELDLLTPPGDSAHRPTSR
jgi:LuxR family maltose regulon positive regulatory protein